MFSVRLYPVCALFFVFFFSLARGIDFWCCGIVVLEMAFTLLIEGFYTSRDSAFEAWNERGTNKLRNEEVYGAILRIHSLTSYPSTSIFFSPTLLPWCPYPFQSGINSTSDSSRAWPYPKTNATRKDPTLEAVTFPFLHQPFDQANLSRNSWARGEGEGGDA